MYFLLRFLVLGFLVIDCHRDIDPSGNKPQGLMSVANGTLKEIQILFFIEIRR